MKPSVKPAARLRVEWLPAMPWNECPRSRGIGALLPWNTHADLIADITAGYPDAKYALMRGHVRIKNLPPDLRDPDRDAERVAWMIAKIPAEEMAERKAEQEAFQAEFGSDFLSDLDTSAVTEKGSQDA